MHPNSGECKGGIVNAHTIQKGRGLRAIAEDGHVLGFDTSHRTLTSTRGRIGIQRVGIRQASTITGFCSFHDDTAFAPVEKVPFTGTPEQCFLLAYRTVCRELYTKKSMLAGMDVLRTADAGRSIPDQVRIQLMTRHTEIGGGAGFRDIERQKVLFDDALLRSDHSNLRFEILWFAGVPDLMNAFGIFPEYDFEGRKLQDLRDAGLALDGITVTTVATDSGAALVLAWMSDRSHACTRFARSLAALTDKEIPDAVVRLFFEHSENTHMRPSWWEGLAAPTKKALITRISDAANYLVDRKPSCLLPDGHHYATWPVVRRSSG